MQPHTHIHKYTNTCTFTHRHAQTYLSASSLPFTQTLAIYSNLHGLICPSPSSFPAPVYSQTCLTPISPFFPPPFLLVSPGRTISPNGVDEIDLILPSHIYGPPVRTHTYQTPPSPPFPVHPATFRPIAPQPPMHKQNPYQPINPTYAISIGPNFPSQDPFQPLPPPLPPSRRPRLSYPPPTELFTDSETSSLSSDSPSPSATALHDHPSFPSYPHNTHNLQREPYLPPPYHNVQHQESQQHAYPRTYPPHPTIRLPTFGELAEIILQSDQEGVIGDMEELLPPPRDMQNETDGPMSFEQMPGEMAMMQMDGMIQGEEAFGAAYDQLEMCGEEGEGPHDWRRSYSSAFDLVGGMEKDEGEDLW